MYAYDGSPTSPFLTLLTRARTVDSLTFVTSDPIVREPRLRCTPLRSALALAALYSDRCRRILSLLDQIRRIDVANPSASSLASLIFDRRMRVEVLDLELPFGASRRARAGYRLLMRPISVEVLVMSSGQLKDVIELSRELAGQWRDAL